MASTKRFISNIGFYALGTFATKILQFLFIPIYSKYIIPTDLGTYNLILAVVSLMIPILFQSIWEGTFRFSIEQGDNGREVIATSSKYCFSLAFVYSISFIIISYVFNYKYGLYVLLYALGQMGTSYWQFAARALKENKIYAVSTVVHSGVSILMNLILILVFHLGLEALLIANISGSFAMIIILEKRIRLISDINKYPFNKALLRNIIKYSLPLAINMISWWLMSSCNNLIITKTLGVGENGIYAIALKFGTLLSIVTSIITMAWQEEAFRSHGEKDQDSYFNKVLNILIKGLLGATLILVPVTYIIYNYFVFGEYKKGVILVAFIYMSAVYNAISCHLGSALLARKESSIMFWTTLLGGTTAVLASVLLINYIGLLGAAIGTAIGNMFNFFVRIPILRKRIDLRVCYGHLICLTILVTIECFICFNVKYNISILFSIVFLGILISGFANKDLIRTLIYKFKRMK